MIAKCALLALFTLHAAGQCTVEERGSLAGAETALAKGNLDDADRLAAAVHRDATECHQAAFVLGKVRAAQGQLVAARSFLSEYSESEPNDARGLETLLSVLRRQGDNSAVAETADRLLLIEPNSVPALLARGETMSRQGREREARESLERACKLAPSNADAHFSLGVFFDGKDWAAEAVAEFRKTVSLDPANAGAWDYLALNLELTGDPAAAEAAYQTGLKVNREPHFDPFLGYNYGRFLMKLGRFQESAPYLDRAVDLSPRTRAVYYERGKLNLALLNYAQARSDGERALAIPDPGGYVLDRQVFYLLATVSERQGDAEAAKRYADLAKAAQTPVRSGGRQ